MGLETFHLEGVIHIKGAEPPPVIEGKIYTLWDFLTSENVELARTLDPRTRVNLDLGRGNFGGAMHVVYTLRKQLPKDIILAAEPGDEIMQYTYPEPPFSSIRAFLSPYGLLAHGAIVDREMAGLLQDRGNFPKHLIGIARVETDRLKSGDEVVITSTPDNKAKIQVRRRK